VPLRQADHSFTSIIRREVAVNAQLNDVNAIEPELNLNPNPRPLAPNKSGKCSTAASLLLWHMARIPPTTGRSNEVISDVNNRERTQTEQTFIDIEHQDV
jgi:hypothetical protein